MVTSVDFGIVDLTGSTVELADTLLKLRDFTVVDLGSLVVKCSSDSSVELELSSCREVDSEREFLLVDVDCLGLVVTLFLFLVFFLACLGLNVVVVVVVAPPSHKFRF